jgi:hypothetical protein
VSEHHVLVVEPDEPYLAKFGHLYASRQDAIEQGCIRFRVECPAGSDPAAACAEWTPCGHPYDIESDDPPESDPCEHSPTGEHQVLQGELMCPTSECFVAGYGDLRDAARDVFDGWRVDAPPPVPGRYPVTWSVEDEEWLELRQVPGSSDG